MICAKGSLTFKYDFSIEIKSVYEASFFCMVTLLISITDWIQQS